MVWMGHLYLLDFPKLSHFNVTPGKNNLARRAVKLRHQSGANPRTSCSGRRPLGWQHPASSQL